MVAERNHLNNSFGKKRGKKRAFSQSDASPSWKTDSTKKEQERERENHERTPMLIKN
jgi:hypothetical protein